MTITNSPEETKPGSALVVLGCPEVPVQQALALHISYQLRKAGISVSMPLVTLRS